MAQWDRLSDLASVHCNDDFLHALHPLFDSRCSLDLKNKPVGGGPVVCILYYVLISLR